MVFVACMHVFLGGLVINFITPWLAQLGEHQSAEWEVMGSNPQLDQHSGSLNNWEESAALVMISANG